MWYVWTLTYGAATLVKASERDEMVQDASFYEEEIGVL